MGTENLVERVVQLSLDNVEAGGKPFACVVVERSSGRVVIEATNQVAQSGDLTAHAEITAIRGLAGRGRTDLQGCDVYVTAYPCPMCLGALYYAQPDEVVYVATREQEGRHYEDGNRYTDLAGFYDEYAKPVGARRLPTRQAPHADPESPFRAWQEEHADD